MAYITAAEVSEAVRGPNRLYGPDGILQGRGDTAGDHPYLDAQLIVASRDADDFLREAGLVTPLTGAIDPLFASAVIGLLIGNVTRDLSSKEQWMADMEAAAREYFARLTSGAAIVDGAEDDPDAGEAIFSPTPVYDDPIFDGPLSGARHVFDDLGGSPYRRGRW